MSRITAVVCLALAATMPSAALAGRTLKGPCTTTACHQATGQADYNKAWNNNYQNAEATGAPLPVGYFSGSLTDAQMQCVTNCQNAQQQAQAQGSAFDWMTCQKNCGV